MLEIAAKHYLTSLGDKSLVPNPDYPEFITAGCLDVVIKRKPKWLWQKAIYTYDNFGLNDLLDVALPNDQSLLLKKPEPLTPNFKWTSQHSMRGEIGGKIASLVALDIAGDDVINVSVDLEDMVIQSIDFSAVQNMLKTRKVDVNGIYLKRLAQDKYNVVCLISQFIYINKPTEIVINVSSHLSESASISNKTAGIVDDGSYKSVKNKSLFFNVGTRIAFTFSECLISPDGKIELLDLSDKVKIPQMIPDLSKMAILPNYCSCITTSNQRPEVTDVGTMNDLQGVFKSLSYLLNHKKMSSVKKSMLFLALDNKKVLLKLELFLLHCLQETSAKEVSIASLKIFENEMLGNVHLMKVLLDIGLSANGSTLTVRASALHQNILSGILCLIQAIYHLDVFHLNNLTTIITNFGSSKIQEILFFLQSIKFLKFFNKAVYNRLVTDSNTYDLLLTVGVNKDGGELNEYFEPIFILLYE